MITCGYRNLVKFTHLISKEVENNKCYVKYVFRKFFKNHYKTIKESISSNVGDLFYSKKHSKDTWVLKRHYMGTQKPLEHLKGIPRTLQGHSNSIWALEALGHSST